MTTQPDPEPETEPVLDIAAWLARPHWMGRAACRGVDPDLFFPERGEASHHAKAICRTCPVQGDCLDYAMINGERHGIWGGIAEGQRRRLRRQVTAA
jgi:WhiB family transcriptional regulator, redox-sensing transcriptional regulator